MHLQTPSDLKKEFPLSAGAACFIDETRKTLHAIYERQDPRILIIVGPCSIHDVEEGLEYARQLKELASECEEECFLMMRTYIEKPRTRNGWKGLVHDPHLNGSDDIAHGLPICRSFLCQLAEMGVPAATEFLTPHLAPYIQDLISWGCIGARTTSSQIHRLLASHLPMPIGFKNTVDGNVDCAINGVHVARVPHTFMHICDDGKVHKVKSSGNPYAHVVLRGSLSGENYNRKSVQAVLGALRQLELPPRVLIDCSHGNSLGQYFKQKEVFQDVLEQIREGNHQIIGMMLESNLEASCQKIPAQLSELQPGVSVTDSCLDLSTTIELIKSSLSSSIVMSLTQS